MDLKNRIQDPRQLEAAAHLAKRGLIYYQPFIFSSRLETGVGFEFAEGKKTGLVYCPDIPLENLQASPELRRLIVDPVYYNQFHEANAKLRQLYEFFMETICDHVGDVRNTTFLDVGCNSGYFPVGFALRGAKKSVGSDREKNFSEAVQFLNAICGTRAEFLDAHYDSRIHCIPGCPSFDVVTSMAVLCHLSDPLFHLEFLGSIARKAVFLWTLVNDDEGYTLHLGEPRSDYKEDRFPLCFDNKICLSRNLIQKSFELMGFKKVIRVPEYENGLPSFSWAGYSLEAILAIK
jgi:SAM-dependent methyltransferase